MADNDIMDVIYEYEGQIYVWNRNKAISNYKKHKISFEEAVTIIFDEDTLTRQDKKHSEGEIRFTAIGYSAKSSVLFVCYCERGINNTIRIYSARKANKREQKLFRENAVPYKKW